MCCYEVTDVDAAVVAVRAAGGTADAPRDEPHGRTADCVDDQGIPFALHTGYYPPLPESPLAYAELRVPDATRARAFYGTVLSWGFEPGGAPGYWHPRRPDGDFPAPMFGLVGGAAEARVVPTFRVPDVAAALAAVRAAGGEAADRTRRSLRRRILPGRPGRPLPPPPQASRHIHRPAGGGGSVPRVIDDGAEVLARVDRAGLVEVVHAGHAVALGADGSPRVRAGNPDRPFLPRSSLKPLQAVAMLRAGLEIDGRRSPWPARATKARQATSTASTRSSRRPGSPRPTCRPPPCSRTNPTPRSTGAAKDAAPSRSPTCAPASTPRCSPPASPRAGTRPPTATRRTRCRSGCGRRSPS